MGRPLCYIGVAMHPAARAKLEEKYDLTENPDRIAEADAAVSYWIPLEWTLPGAAGKLKTIGCHSCDQIQRTWAYANGIRVTLADSLWRTAALDVFWNEGSEQKKELTERDNVIMSPHLGGSIYECDMVLVNGVL